MAGCAICESKTLTTHCELCTSVMEKSKKSTWTSSFPLHVHRAAVDVIGTQSTPKRRWKALKDHVLKTGLSDWVLLNNGQSDHIQSLPCTPEELDLILSKVKTGAALLNHERRILHHGFLLTDGTCISFNDSKVVINGHSLKSDIPLYSVLKIITDPGLRRGIDLVKLLSVMGCYEYSTRANDRAGIHWNHIHARIQEMRRNSRATIRSVRSLLSWVKFYAHHQVGENSNQAISPLAAWARDVERGLPSPELRGFEERVIKLISTHPFDFSLIGLPWARLWTAPKQNEDHLLMEQSQVLVSNGAWKMRVRRKDNATITTSVPDDPILWAFLLSASLSPPSSNASIILQAIQYNWSQQYDVNELLPAPLIRSLELMSQIIKSNPERVFVEGKKILVIGQLGHYYELFVGNGAHGAPYIINNLFSLKPNRGEHICIHSGRLSKTLPMGDIFASAILSLLSDVNTASKIDSLARSMAMYPPIGFRPSANPVLLKEMDQPALSEFKRVEAAGFRAHWAYELSAHGGNWIRHMERRGRAMDNRNWQELNNIAETSVRNNLGMPTDQFVALWRKHLSSRRDPRDTFFELHQNELRGDELGLGDIRYGERRWCELFERVWYALGLQSLGASVVLAQQGDTHILEFQECGLMLTIRDANERSAILKFAEILGYQRHGEGEQYLEYQRVQGPQDDWHNQLSVLLNRHQTRQGRRGEAPWWWSYRRVETEVQGRQEFPWQLEEDWRDPNRVDNRMFNFNRVFD